jgi:flagellar basal body rod protein FlgB
MPIFEIFDPTFVNLQQGIEKATRKQSVIAQNIANINNPGYEALEFDDVLNRAVKRANKKVILEEELASLSKNTMEHSAYIKLFESKMSVMRSVVTQGRK